MSSTSLRRVRQKPAGSKCLPQTYQVPSRHGGAPYNFFRPGPGQKAIGFGRGHQNDPKIKAAWKQLMAGQPTDIAARTAKPRTRAGTWNQMMEFYKASDAFKNLDDKTANERSMRIIIECQKMSDALVVETVPSEIGRFISLIKTNDTPAAKEATGIPYGGYGTAKNLRNVWSRLYQQAILEGLVIANPIRDIDRPKTSNPDGHADWTEAEIAQYRQVYPDGLPRLALDAALATGMRVSDLVLAGPGFVKTDKAGKPFLSFIAYKRRRMGEKARCTVPMSKELQATLAAKTVVGQTTWLVGDRGKAMTAKYLSEQFAKWIDAAKLPDHCVAHGLRKSFVRRMIDQGVEPLKVAAMTGHQDMALVLFYAEKRNRELAALSGRDAIDMAEAA